MKQEVYGTIWLFAAVGFLASAWLASSFLFALPAIVQFAIGAIVGGLPGAILGSAIGGLILRRRGR